MTVQLAEGVIHLTGRCPAEDTEHLLELLSSGLKEVDLTGCDHLHTAVFQLLMAAKADIGGEPSAFLRDWLAPVLTKAAKS